MNRAFKPLLLLLLAAILAPLSLRPPNASADFREPAISYDQLRQQWDLDNGALHVTMEFRGSGLVIAGIGGAGATWTAPAAQPSSPIRFSIDERESLGADGFRLVGQRIEAIPHNGRRLTILLDKLDSSAQVAAQFEMFNDHPVLRHRVSFTNRGSARVYMTAADLLPYRFQLNSNALDVFHIDQWDPTTTTSFQLHRELLSGEGGTVALRTGADARDIAWLAFRDQDKQGLFAGLEFDGRAQWSLFRSGADGSLQLSALMPGLHHPVAPGETFTLPSAFVGVFRGEWDDAGDLTRRFSEAVLAQPAPPDYPWVSWDSWGYGVDINEQNLRQNAELAAKLGIEVFVIDLGWAEKMGDWRADPAKFPSGLRSLSDYVHSLGMKFGLHFAVAEAHADSRVLREHPDWTASEDNFYFGATSICLGHAPVRAWLVDEAVRMIDDYQVDYIVQDGENMVKRCRRTDHTHHSLDSNYSNSVDGLNAVVSEIQRRRPNVLWENCEDGGHMMTFQMVQQYVTSITNDASGALDSRKGVWGATYPFSARYTSRYMWENPASTYFTRSYMFGGPWHFMNRLPDMSTAETEFGAREIAVFKKIRGLIRDGRTFHLTEPPAEGRIDALQSYHAGRDASVIVVVRDGGTQDQLVIHPQGLRPDALYRVHFEDDPRQVLLSGKELLSGGVTVQLPAARSGEIVYIDSAPRRRADRAQDLP
jgi:alpha-galactosidase